MMHRGLTAAFAFLLVLGSACSSSSQELQSVPGGSPLAPPVPEGKAEAIFAGGCFWCLEAAFEGLEGVESVTSGYTGGQVPEPTYEQVSTGRTGHAESVRIVYDPRVTTYQHLLDVYWHNVDPTQGDGQFCDHGDQYRTAIFVVDERQRRLAEASRARVRRQLGRPLFTEIVDAGPFWVAESHHQNFCETHPARYQSYRAACGRDQRLRQLWGASGGH